jgi:hypothetical protein
LCSSCLFHRTSCGCAAQKGWIEFSNPNHNTNLSLRTFSAQIHFYLRPKDPTCASWSTMSGILLYPCLIKLSYILVQKKHAKCLLCTLC